MKLVHRQRAWEHIHELADHYGITVRKAKSWHLAEAHVSTRQVWVPPRMVDALSYLIALHEFGHIACPLSRRLDTVSGLASSLQCEAAAWSWAIEHADPVLLRSVTPRQWDVIGALWSSHAWHAVSQVPA